MWILETLTSSEVDQFYTPASQTVSQAQFSTDPVRYRLPVGTWVVGRKDADIEIPDKAVSRKHAQFTVAACSHADGTPGAAVSGAADALPRPPLSVCDLGSSYGTMVNGSERLPKGEPRILEPGDVVRFGLQWAAVRVAWEPLVLCMTRLGKKEKAALKEAAAYLGAAVVSDWSPHVTHMATSKELVFTVKTVLAVVDHVPCVKPSWAEAIATKLQTGSLRCSGLPDPKAHALSAAGLGQLAHPDPRRKTHLEDLVVSSPTRTQEGRHTSRTSW